MKHIIINSLILFFTIANFAQTVVPIETEYTTNFLATNVYFKDINDELNKFIGTWKYEDSSTNTIFEITFYKEENIEGLRNCTYDRLNANFKLIQLGTEQYNTYTTNYGKMIIGRSFFSLFDYDAAWNVTRIPPSVNRYHLCIVEPDLVGHLQSSDLTITYENTAGIEKLNWKNTVNKVLDYITNQQVNVYKMPLEMVLIKQ